MLKIPESSMKVKIKKIKKLQDDVRFNSGGDAPPGRKSQVQQQDAAQGTALPMTSKGGRAASHAPFLPAHDDIFLHVKWRELLS